MDDFDRGQFKRFKEVEEKRFFWQTKDRYIADKEKELLDILISSNITRMLELGCGEGANLFNISSRGFAIGIDYSFNRLRFAKANVNINTNTKFACADATRLPFLDGKFDLVFSRDLLHHLHDQEKAILEMIRVCRDKGRLAIIEMNGRSNFIGRIFASAIKIEQGMKYINIKQITSILNERGAVNIKVIMKQPILLYRVVFHHLSFLRCLSRFKFFIRLSDLIEKIGSSILPKERWGYIVILADKASLIR